MFDSLSEKIQGAFSKLTKRGGHLSEQDVKDSLRAIRVALLEADVSLDVVKEFIKNIREKAVGEEVIKSVKPGDQVVKIVQDELERFMGESNTEIAYREEGPTVILMSGLQGSGKTTTCGKLANFLTKRDKRKPLLVAADLKRPAAVSQLKTIGKSMNFPVYSEENSNPVQVCANAVQHAKETDRDLVILDTAGRLHVDDELMRELVAIHKSTSPDQTFLVCDAMTGQDAVNSAKAFHEKLELQGVILTKLDSDTRGGAALSLRHVTGCPIKFAGIGEQMDKLEEFHPQRMAGRILGMGDIVTLVEKAQDAISEEEAMEMHEKLLKNKFSFDDFLQSFKAMKKMGGFKDLLKMIPGMGNALKDVEIDDKQMPRIEAFILSMTPAERKNPDLLDGSRRKRIASGAGQTVQAFNQFLGQYTMMQKMMSGKGGGMMANLKKMMGGGLGGAMGGAAPAGMPAMPDIPDNALSLPKSKEEQKRDRKLRKELKAKRKRSRRR